jgi:ferredoxin-NADP reductase
MTWEADGVLSVGLEPEDGSPSPLWEPGAHVDVEVHDTSARQYSLCGRPGDRGLRIAVLRESGGRGGSEWFHGRVRPGDVLTLRGPRNHFRLEPAGGYLFVAGGIGITPMLPMIAEAEQRGADWRLAYFGRSRRSMAFLRELEPYGDRVLVLAKGEQHGQQLAPLLAASPASHLVYVCGPSRLSDEVASLLALSGEEDRLRTEHFAAPVGAGTDESGAFTVHLERTGIDLTVPADRSVLDVLDEAGLDILSDCQEGICGSCETSVLAGDVDHRDFVLTTQEKKESTCMMVCVSRALSPRLVLDL